MSEVKRYKAVINDKPYKPYAYCEESSDGIYVRLEDYTALREQLTATTNSLTNAQEALKSAGIEADTVQAGVMELKVQRDALAANEGYKQAFYEIADILSIGARPDSPKNVFEQVIKPILLNLKKERAEMDKQEPIYQYMTVSMSDKDWLGQRWHDCTKEEFDDAKSECAPVRVVYAQQQPILAEGLHPETAELVVHFAEALAKKLHRSEQKYGWSDGWKDVGWQDKCQADFHHHISKGDPRDVAAYCAFMWYHGWPTQSAPAIDLNAVWAEGVEMWIASRNGAWNGTTKQAEHFAAQLRAGNAGKDGV